MDKAPGTAPGLEPELRCSRPCFSTSRPQSTGKGSFAEDACCPEIHTPNFEPVGQFQLGGTGGPRPKPFETALGTALSRCPTNA